MISLKNSIVKGWFFNMKFYLVTVNSAAFIFISLAGNARNNTSLKILKAPTGF